MCEKKWSSVEEVHNRGKEAINKQIFKLVKDETVENIGIILKIKDGLEILLSQTGLKFPIIQDMRLTSHI